MVNTARVADLIREGRSDEITEAIDDGGFHHMQSFTNHLVQLVLAGHVEEEVAANAAPNRHDFEIAVQKALRQKRVADAAEAPPDGSSKLQAPEKENEVRLRLASSDQ
jgi:Tfp pilus assembly ATPase PilU